VKSNPGALAFSVSLTMAYGKEAAVLRTHTSPIGAGHLERDLFTFHNHQAGQVFLPSQIRTLWPKMMNELTQDQRANRWQNCDLNYSMRLPSCVSVGSKRTNNL
jgi:hypothetical protein